MTLRCGNLRFLGIAMLVALAGGLAAPLLGQGIPLYQADAFDRIAVKDEAGQIVAHRILPLDLEQRAKWRETGSKEKTLSLHLLDAPEELYEVDRANIVKIEFFEDRLSAEIARAISNKRYDDAFLGLMRLKRDYPDHPDFPKLSRDFLVQEATQAVKAQAWETAWLRLDQAWEIRPDDSEVKTLLSQTLQALLAQSWSQQDDRETQRWLGISTTRYGETQQPLLDEWRARIQERIATLTGQFQTHFAAEDYVAAYDVARQLGVWSEFDHSIRTLLPPLYAKFPTVRVGVMQGARPTTPSPTVDARPFASVERLRWPTARVARLVGRDLIEPIAVGVEGCRYVSPLGELRSGESVRQWQLQLSPPWATHDFWVSQAVLAFGRQPEVRGRLLRELDLHTSLRGDGVVNLSIHRPYLLFPALVRVPLQSAWPPNIAYEAATANEAATAQFTSSPDAAFVWHAKHQNSHSFVANPRGVWRQAETVQQVVEMTLRSTSQGIEQLRRNELDILDRVFPAEIPGLRDDQDFTVIPYATPSIHYLEPNPARPWLASRTLRRALLYLLDRRSILHSTLLAGQSVPGCRLISAPIPAGTNPEDPIAYAYDESLEPMEANVGTGLLLLEAALGELKRVHQVDLARSDLKLTVVHGPDELSTEACAAICRQWSSAGLPSVPVSQAEGDPLTDDWDFRYQDIVMTEPLVDIGEVVTPMLRAGGTPYLRLALQRVHAATDWQTARLRLRELHRILHDDVTVLALWQLQDYAVHRTSCSGLSHPLMTLYQTVEQWQVAQPGTAQGNVVSGPGATQP